MAKHFPQNDALPRCLVPSLLLTAIFHGYIYFLIVLMCVCFQAEHVQTMSDESRSEGTIGVRMYLKYLSAGVGAFVLLILVLLNLLAQVQHAI